MLAAAQVLICNYLHLSQFIYLSILPAIILLIPIRFGTPAALCIAFICGMLTDLLGDGVLGLNTFALLPVALLRPSLIRLVCGEEIFARKEDISIARQGYIKISICLIVAQAIFLLLYGPTEPAQDPCGSTPSASSPLCSQVSCFLSWSRKFSHLKSRTNGSRT